MKPFQSHQKGGVSFTYDNGYTVSIQFKYGNYCETNATTYDFEDTICAENTEIAVIASDGNWHTKEVYLELFNEDIGDDVVGYVTVEDLLKIQIYVQAIV